MTIRGKSLVSRNYQRNARKLEKLLKDVVLEKELYLGIKAILHEAVKETAEEMYLRN